MPSGAQQSDDERLVCGTSGCEESADFWQYTPTDDQWGPYCSRHLIHLHPSIELKAWLESGYARPAERGKPNSPPPSPQGGRVTAFRNLIETTVDWTDL